MHGGRYSNFLLDTSSRNKSCNFPIAHHAPFFGFGTLYPKEINELLMLSRPRAGYNCEPERPRRVGSLVAIRGKELPREEDA
ncbi:hypothetical protein KFK09_022757 [Dendrobium nobile]|uniref:Uncharacterized protein n=1 Tax=Dendrobium nobile TaxID=94219 RepID=A0A8T3AK10_DENNO|nr:hypothetical protein KFK09_022755 [Dendrobium nobile]KAI0496440.1 hypothetical protein KFK09_022757 [Dendrobium nobile]